MTPPLAPAKGYYDGTHIVLTSPVHFARGQEVLVTPSAARTPPRKQSWREFVESLVGLVPDTGKTLEEYRDERLQKYERPD
jgi:hypothetical protein